ncbi:dihydrodipicolinate synthase family protein [uncultured Friedmanniella sp.]|uniref:dihydrodipicolinate synthase family protein n=1 Tax=uncultured Friedmanniella sp. TaxID=335381 RepID=UPI0035CA312F
MRDTHREVSALLRAGSVIPAHPLALNSQLGLDVRRQRALTRYYVDAGAGGVAVGVHTTQFGIREHGLYPTVLQTVAEAATHWTERPFALVAGVTGSTTQAVEEARVAAGLGYHAALVNVAAFAGQPEQRVLDHCRSVAEIMPIIGFSLLPEVGGFHLSYEFWREFAQIDQVVAIKLAPFNRYRTVDIVRAVVDARAEDRVTLYTGNDDHIVLDLLVPFRVRRDGVDVRVRIMGGLLGHWSVWTKQAVELLQTIHLAAVQPSVSNELLALDSVVTDMNSAVYDAGHDFAGCIPGCLEVLRRQGLLDAVRCLDPGEVLAPGQAEAIDRVVTTYPELTDDDFVRQHLSRWLGEVGDPNPTPLTEMVHPR